MNSNGVDSQRSAIMQITMIDDVLDDIGKISVPEQTAQRIAAAFVEATFGKTFAVVNSAHYYSKPEQRALWRFFIRCEHGPLGVIYVDPQSGQVLPWTADEMRIVQEKAALLHARHQGVLPLDQEGYVLREYARRQANSYLSMVVGLQVIATDPIFVPLDRPIWQFLVELRLPRTGTVGIFGMLDVDACSGEVIPLTNDQIQQIWKRGNAATEFCTQKTAR
jgi:hypothetical protein